LRIIGIPRGGFPERVVEDEFEVNKTSGAVDEEVDSSDALAGKSCKQTKELLAVFGTNEARCMARVGEDMSGCSIP
jgi:hypothetical protein